MEVKQKSIKVNFIFNLILNICSVMFPLITFPYVSRVLNPEGIGRVNYVASIVSYLSLLAELGVGAYGIKEGARYRDDKEKLGKFVSELLFINLMAVIFSYSILGIVVFMPEFRNNVRLLIIYGTTICVTPFSMNWFISLMEEYRYTTIRTLCVQLIGMIMVFTFIKNADDLIKYAMINAASGIMTMLINIRFSCKKIKLFRYKDYQIRKHIKPILFIFGSGISATIFLNSDITILGYMRGDYFVGLYSSAVKVIRIIIMFAVSLTTVMMPRIAYYKSKHFDDEYKAMLKKETDFLLMTTISASVGVFFVAGDIVSVLLGSRYLNAELTIKVLALDIILSPFGGFISYQIVLPHNKEKIFFSSTLISCIFNVVLNIIFIPEYAHNAAACTTLLSEAVNIMICYFATRKEVSYKKCFENIREYVYAATAMIPAIYIIQNTIDEILVRLAVEIALSAFIYVIILLKMKNEMAIYLKHSLLGRIKIACQCNRSSGRS